MEVVWAAPPTGAPLARQGRFASLRDGLRPPLDPRASARPDGRRKGRSETCPAHSRGPDARSREGQDPTHGNVSRSLAAHPLGAVFRQLRLAGLRGDSRTNLLRAAGTLAGGDAAVARRCHPAPRPGQRARPVSPLRPASRCCTYQPTGPGKPDGKLCGTTSSATRPRNRAPPDSTGFSCPPGRPGPT